MNFGGLVSKSTGGDRDGMSSGSVRMSSRELLTRSIRRAGIDFESNRRTLVDPTRKAPRPSTPALARALPWLQSSSRRFAWLFAISIR
jgi:hypothetical protein